VFIILSLSMCGMGTCVYLEASTFPNQQLLIVFIYTFLFCMCYLVSLLIFWKYSFMEIIGLLSFKKVGIIGAFWAMNYTFILISAPFIPNTLQVVLAQVQVVLIAIIDRSYLGIQLNWLKILFILGNILGNLVALVGNVKESAYSTYTTLFWSIVFMFNSLAGGAATLYSESLMKIQYGDFRREHPSIDGINASLLPGNDDEDHDGPLEDEITNLDPREKLRKVCEINFGANAWSLVFCLFGIKLSYLATPDFSVIFDTIIFTDKRAWFWVGMLFSSFIYTTCSYYLTWQQSALFSTMASSLGSFLQAFFVSFAFFGDYQDAPTPIKIVSVVVVTLSSLGYTLKEDKRNYKVLRSSYLGKMYSTKNAGEGNTVFYVHVILVLSVYLLLFLIAIEGSLSV